MHVWKRFVSQSRALLRFLGLVDLDVLLVNTANIGVTLSFMNPKRHALLTVYLEANSKVPIKVHNMTSAAVHLRFGNNKEYDGNNPVVFHLYDQIVVTEENVAPVD